MTLEDSIKTIVDRLNKWTEDKNEAHIIINLPSLFLHDLKSAIRSTQFSYHRDITRLKQCHVEFDLYEGVIIDLKIINPVYKVQNGIIDEINLYLKKYIEMPVKNEAKITVNKEISSRFVEIENFKFN